jgi:hypothetical protein
MSAVAFSTKHSFFDLGKASLVGLSANDQKLRAVARRSLGFIPSASFSLGRQWGQALVISTARLLPPAIC